MIEKGCKFAIALAMVIVVQIAETTGHQEATSALTDSSDDNLIPTVDREGIGRRRSFHKQEWQYEGLPIEFPTRRHMEKQAEPHKKPASTRKKHSSGRRHQKQKGLGMEVPSYRRHFDNKIVENNTTTTPTTTTTTTTAAPDIVATSPALDRRYRRIYNPDEVATIEEYPFMAALMVNSELWCGAVIISRDTVLTAAHCLQLQYNNRFFREYVKMLTIRVGSSNVTVGGELVRVSEIFFHPNYKPQTLEFNVALLKTHKNLTFGRDEPKIDLIEYSRDKIVPVDNKITFLGWGSVLGAGGTGGQVLLQKLELPVYDLADCQDVYGRELVTRNNFCAGYITISKNVCNHDAGGPAIMNGRLVGILSFSSKRCDRPDQPAVFSTVGAIAPWIESLGEKKFQLRNTAIKTPT